MPNSLGSLAALTHLEINESGLTGERTKPLESMYCFTDEALGSSRGGRTQHGLGASRVPKAASLLIVFFSLLPKVLVSWFPERVLLCTSFWSFCA